MGVTMEQATAILSLDAGKSKTQVIITEIALGSDITSSGSEVGSSYLPSQVCSTPASELADPLEFWQSSPDVTPCHFPTSSATKSDTRSFSENISLDDLPGLASLREQYGVTPATAVKVGWLLVLQTYTGQNSVCLDTLSTDQVDVKTCAFDFANDPEVAQVLSHVQQEELNSPSQTDPSAKASERLCNTAFTQSNTDLREYDILLQFQQSDKDIGVTLVYRGSVISQAQAKRVRATFRQVLQSIVASPSSRASAIRRLSEEDRDEILNWNERIPPILNQSLHHVFSEKALDNPESLAISAWDGELTYGELDEASTRLANHLAGLIGSSEGAPARIAFAFEKSKVAIVAMLAILKTGSTCVPLDPNGSDRALQERLLAVGAKSVCVSPSKADRFTSFKGQRVIVDSALLDSLAPADPSFNPTSDGGDIAFIEYTAGSDVRPKGVLLGHGALYTGILEQCQSLGYDQNSKVLQHAPYTASLSVGDIFGAFLYDSCLVIPREEDSNRDLIEVIHRQEVTHACLSPRDIKNVQADKIAHLKGLALVGEPSNFSNIEAWSETTDVVKVYGTTETSVLCTISKWVPLDSSVFLNIGKPFASSAWIVDPSDVNQIIPIGSVGELVLGGPTLAIGYLDQTAHANAFFTNPTWAGVDSTITQERYFRTGDLVRYVGNGDLELVGRT